MEVESGLQPVWLRLQTKALQALTRMHSLSAKHPLHTWLANALRTRTAVYPYLSNFENILRQFPQTTERTETIEPYIRPPWWTPKIKVIIEETKDKAKDQHDTMIEQAEPHTAVIYTDGSSIRGNIGAAMYSPTMQKATYQHLGKDTQYNVYISEITALRLAAEELCGNHQITECHIYTDSQAAIKAINNPRRQSGQQITKEVLDCIDEATRTHPSLQITIIWIPSHSEIEGNEQVDREAKKAALLPEISTPIKHKPMKSARTRMIKELAAKTWKNEWNSTKTARRLHRITKRRGVKSGPKLYNEILNRNTVATIAQLRTGHCGLNYHLHRLGNTASPYCECGSGKETVEHYLLECRNYNEQRKTMREKIRKGRLTVEKLLGDPRTLNITMEYIRSTKRFK